MDKMNLLNEIIQLMKKRKVKMKIPKNSKST